MVRTYIFNVATKDGLKPVKFHSLVGFEFWTGLGVDTIRAYTLTGRFPRSPFTHKRGGGLKVCRNIMLYTEEMLQEALELFNNYYPPFPRRGNPLRKATYKIQNNLYKDKVIELENKWKVGDYLERAPATPKPLTKAAIAKERKLKKYDTIT